MTRDEAVAKLKAVKNHGDYTFNRTMSAHGLVDGLNALGILKLDEPETARDRYFRMANREVGPVIASVIFDRLEGIGLRIVEK